MSRVCLSMSSSGRICAQQIHKHAHRTSNQLCLVVGRRSAMLTAMYACRAYTKLASAYYTQPSIRYKYNGCVIRYYHLNKRTRERNEKVLFFFSRWFYIKQYLYFTLVMNIHMEEGSATTHSHTHIDTNTRTKIDAVT